MDDTPEQLPDCSPIPFRSHTALLLSAALPYLQPGFRHPVELALKFLEFSETMKLYREFHTLGGSPFSFFHSKNTPDHKDSGLFGLLNNVVLDLEGLLNSLSCVCTGGEREIIGMFLNMIRVKNFYETYGDLMNLSSLMSGVEPQCQQTAPKTEAEPHTDPGGFPFSPDLTSMLSADQKETLDLLKSLFSSE